MGHAVLIHGPEGTGKSVLGDRLAQALLCESPQDDGRACERCAACNWYAQGNHPDFRRVEPGTEDAAGDGAPPARGSRRSRDIRIAQIRAALELTEIGAHRAGARVVLIDPADAMNAAAANALLKTLEEPPPGVYFVLVTSRVEHVLPTVRSRCIRFHFALPPPGIAADWLAARMGIAPAEAAQRLAAAAGAPLAALADAEPARSTAHRLVLETLAALPDKATVELADAIADVDPLIWVPMAQRWMVDAALAAAGLAPRYFPGSAEALQRAGRRLDPERLGEIQSGLARQRALVGHPLNARLHCEETLAVCASAFRHRSPA